MADNQKFIIKMPDADAVPDHGLGFEIYHKMRHHKDSIAEYIIETDETRTYGDILDDSVKTAINLRKYNLDQEDIIAVCSWNNKYTYIPYIAGLFNGNIVTYLDPVIVPKDRASLLRKVTPKILFVDEDKLENIEETLRVGELIIDIIVLNENSRGHTSFHELLEISEVERRDFQPVKIDNGRTGVIIFSNGTTGNMKGICLSHEAFLSQTSGPTPPIGIILNSPNKISHNLVLIRYLRNGGARVLYKFNDMRRMWKIIDEYRINLLIGAVYLLCEMIEYAPENDLDLTSLNLVMTSGSRLPLQVCLRMKKVVPQVMILQAYGLSESCGPTLIFNLASQQEREWHKSKPESCGTPIRGVWYKVVDPETEEILGPNRPGELRMKSKLSMLGYYNEDCSNDFDAEGYLKTGDIVIYDEDRCFYVVDRMREMLFYRGIVISSTVIENILMSHPSVALATVIGIPHIEDVDHPMAVVKLKQECVATPEELIKYVDDKITDKTHRLYAGVKIVKDLPMNAGKVNKRKLREMVLAGDL